MHDQANGLRELAQKSLRKEKKQAKTKTIVITSGKGGVGKSTFSLNFALALKEQGYRVAILDADLGLANIDLMMGITAPFNILHLINGEKTLKEILVNGPGGVLLVPGGSGIMSIAELDVNKLRLLINSLAVLDKYLDFLIIDTGAGINKQVLTFALAADEIMVVSTPEPTSLADAFGIIKVINQGNPVIPLGILINQADNLEHGLQIYKRLNVVCEKYVNRGAFLAGIIPSDLTISKAIRNQVPLLIYQPNCKAALAIKKTALDYLEIRSFKTNANQPESRGLKGLLEKMARLLR